MFYLLLQQLTIQELTLLHARTCKVNKMKMTNENGSINKNKYLTQLQILEQEIMRKQKNTIEECKYFSETIYSRAFRFSQGVTYFTIIQVKIDRKTLFHSNRFAIIAAQSL